MTKTIIIGEKTKPAPKPKKIQFIKSLGRVEEFHDAASAPKDWNFIELITQKYSLGEYDLMFAYDYPDKREIGVLYLGYWNDGVA
jgi:hypothetical protein